MTRKEFLQYSNKRKSLRTYERNILPSVADPTQAQSGRDLVFNPKPIVFDRVVYSEGVPASQMKSFDRMYADRIESFADAQAISNEVREKIKKLPKDNPTPQPPKEDL